MMHGKCHKCGSPRSRCDRDLMTQTYQTKNTSLEAGMGTTLAKGDFVEDFVSPGHEAFERQVKSWA